LLDLIVTGSRPGALAAKAATRDIPIVFSMVNDPVASGVVASLARPDGNLTGWSNMLPETSAKLLELLKEVMPNGSNVAVLSDQTNPGSGRTALSSFRMR
jgi:putative ABC transport system substrate-binding protein